MKRARWLAVWAIVCLSGCRPAELTVEARSRRLTERLVAEVPADRAELVAACVESLLGKGWRVHRLGSGELCRLELSRRRRLVDRPGVELQRRVIGPLGLRVEHELKYPNPLAQLAADDPLRQAVAGLDAEIIVRVVLPGRPVDAAAGAGVTEFRLPLGQLAGGPPEFTATARAWRGWLLGLLALIGLVLLWILWPVLVPSPEERRLRAEKRRAAREAARARTEAKRARQARREAARETKAARRARPAEPAPVPPEADNTAAEAAPVVESDPAEAPAVEATPAAPPRRNLLLWRRPPRQNPPAKRPRRRR